MIELTKTSEENRSQLISLGLQRVLLKIKIVFPPNYRIKLRQITE